MDNNETPFHTRNSFGILVTHRYFTEITPSTGADLGTLMLHQGSDFHEVDETITLQPKRARVARVTRLVRDSAGVIRPQARPTRLKPGSLVRFGSEPHRFDLSNLKPMGSPLRTPLPVIDASAYADAKAVHGLQRKLKAMERFEAARTGSDKPAEETVAEAATELGGGLWACRQDGGWLLIDEAASLVETPTFFDKREELDAMVAELRAN